MTLYRLLLRLFPRAFRQRFGDDMAAVFDDRRRRARREGAARVVALWRRVILDTLQHGFAERLRVRRLAGRNGMFTSLVQDARYGVRTLVKQPLVTTIAVATLALGIGGNTAVFSVTEALLLQPLPYPHAERIYALRGVNQARAFSGNVAVPNFDDWRGRVNAIEAGAAWSPFEVNLASRDGADRVAAAMVTGEFFAVVGARPMAGRLFGDEARTPGDDRVAVLTTRMRDRLLGADGGGVGNAVTLDGVRHVVVGVIEPVAGLDDIEVWRPLARQGAATSRRNHAYRAYVRLKPDVTLSQAEAEFAAVAKALEVEYPDSNAGWSVELAPLQQALTADIESTVRLVSGIVALVLLIACANVAGLLLTRVADRRREFAVRAALGAPRRRLIRQVLTESVVLSLAGAAAGLFLAWLATDLLIAVVARDADLWRQPTLSAGVLRFTTVVSVLTGLLFGLAPAWTTRQMAPQTQMRGTSASVTRAGRRMRTALVFAQIGLASALLVGSGVVVTSLARALGNDSGMDPGYVVTFRISPPAATYPDVAALDVFTKGLLGRLDGLPEVEAVGATARLPMNRVSTLRGVIRAGDPEPERGQERLALYDIATPGFMTAMGMRVLAGRQFSSYDTTNSRPVAIINAALARDLWPDGDAVGREILVHTDESETREVVGIIADLRFRGLDRPILPQYYVPMAQAPQRSLSVAARLRAGATPPDLRALVQSIDATLPVYDVQTVASLMRGSVAERRAMTVTLVGFGGMAVLLAATGLYGVVAMGVRERRREIGIRMAIGASASSVQRMFVRQGLTLAVVGLAAGLTVAYWLTAWMRDLLVGLEGVEPAVLLAVVSSVLATALVATWFPARQAARVEPVSALRSE